MNIEELRGYKTAREMEEAGLALGIISDPMTHGVPHIFYDQASGGWVAFDETGDELCRDSSYWKVRDKYCLHGAAVGAKVIPATGQIWRHRNGVEYEVMYITNIGHVSLDNLPCVVYTGANGRVWSKTMTYFLDRMTFVRESPKVDCLGDATCVPALRIASLRPGSLWNTSSEEEDFPTADIDIEYPDGEVWNGNVQVHGRDARAAQCLRDYVIEGLVLRSLQDQHPGQQIQRERPGSSGTLLEFDVLLAELHKQVWEGAAFDLGYDEVGNEQAKALQAMFHRATHPVDAEGNSFEREQWWLQELSAMLQDSKLKPDQRRAIKVALNLSEAVLPPLPATPPQAHRDHIMNRCTRVE